MLAVRAVRVDPDAPLDAVEVAQHPAVDPPAGWVRVRVRAASLNHHDLWTLRGVGVDPARLPIVLGCDAVGETTSGDRVLVHAVIGDPGRGRGDETLDADGSILSERYDGTFAEYVNVPERNLLSLPSELSDVEAACLPTAWLTAYRMLFTKARLRPGQRVLVQGSGGGVASAAISLAAATGLRVYATAREADRGERARGLGAVAVVGPGERLPERVDAVIETVGAATWGHSLRSLVPGGVLVVAGATSGDSPSADLRRVFYRQLSVLGSTMGTKAELADLVRLLTDTGLRPVVDATYPLEQAPLALARLAAGDVVGKLVLLP